jgi:hypothetical protein
VAGWGAGAGPSLGSGVLIGRSGVLTGEAAGPSTAAGLPGAGPSKGSSTRLNLRGSAKHETRERNTRSRTEERIRLFSTGRWGEAAPRCRVVTRFDSTSRPLCDKQSWLESPGCLRSWWRAVRTHTHRSGEDAGDARSARMARMRECQVLRERCGGGGLSISGQFASGEIQALERDVLFLGEPSMRPISAGTDGVCRLLPPLTRTRKRLGAKHCAPKPSAGEFTHDRCRRRRGE